MYLIFIFFFVYFRKSKEYIYNYVDRVRFAEGNFPDYKCPTRGSGWRHNKSVSHLDLATSCHSAASGLNHWSSSHQTRHHQLRHSRSLDYNHIDRCKDALDIAEYYWHLEPEPEVYDEEEEEIIEPEHSGSQQQQQQQLQQQQQQQPLKYVSEHHQHYRDFKCADDNYHHHSSNNLYQSSQQQQQQQQHQPRQPQQQNVQHQSTNSIPLQAFEFANDSCSLRRSRSLAVIREETFSDLQISSSNASRRSQLIPRARLVNRGYFRERERLICGNNKHYHHHHTSTNCNSSGCVGGCAVGTCAGIAGAGGCYCQEPDEQSNESIAETCDSHKQQLIQLQHHKQQQLQQQQQQQHLHYHPHFHDSQQQQTSTSTTNDYYEHLKRLDKLALGLVAEQLHPWHNDKSDLESLNSDYFKNSLHQSGELKKQFEFETLEQAVSLLAQEKPRIYQSRRQKRSSVHEKTQKLSNSASGAESCPENSQSSVFPETTTSNSDDQTDSASLSEQEYDITKIEEIFQKTHIEGDEESYEIISLTTTTRTRIETTEDEAEEEGEEQEEGQERQLERQTNRQRLFTEIDDFSRHYEEQEGEDTEESNRHTTTDTEIEGTLKRSRAVNANLPKLIAYDSVYLSSEEGSDCTLIDIDNYDTSLEASSLRTCIDEVETLLHISIEDATYEPRAKQHKIEIELEHIEQPESLTTQSEPTSFVESVKTKIEILEKSHDSDLEEETNSPVYTQILKVEHTPSGSGQQLTSSNSVGVTSSAASKPKILSVVEKRKLKRYSDSAYSSNVSDSSEKGLAHGTYGPTEVYAFNSHIKRQVAEPLYITLKSNLSDNQYHSLPDVNIGQCLKVSESIDAQLRSCYNHDNYSSLDDNATADCQSHETSHATTLVLENHCNNCKQRDDIVTSEQIYDSIKRFGRAHQKYKLKESKKFEEEQAREQNKVIANSTELSEDKEVSFKEAHETKDTFNSKEDNNPLAAESTHKQDESVTSLDGSLDTTTTPIQNFYSLEKSKDAPGIEIENFSQQIERRAKEIRAISRRTQSQHIEYANRAKFRLENTLAEFTEEAVDLKSRQTLKPPSIRIVVTDAQNNIIEEDSIESHKTNEEEQQFKQEDEKENRFKGNLNDKVRDTTTTDDLLMVKFSKERLKDKTNSASGGSFRRAPTKPKRQQYPNTATAIISPPLSRSESKKLLLSPKTKERRVLSNQIYRARPVKVITTTTTTKTTTTTTDSFRRNKVKYNSNKMSRPQILQVIDNKRKLENALVGGHNATATNAHTTSFIGRQQQYESSQAENEYLKKVDAVRCYWSKLVNEDTEQPQQPQLQLQQREQEPSQQQQIKNEKLFQPLHKEANEQFEEKEHKSFVKQSKPSNDMENLNESQLQQQHNLEKKQFILGSQDEVVNRKQTTTSAVTTTTKSGDTKTKQQDSNSNNSNYHHKDDDYSSFMPSIEIVELEGDKKATIVSAAVVDDCDEGDGDSNDANEPQFDHIRYKILKSQQLLRSNVLARNKKEAQFDGLIQYLQEYSFQELLSNNNVVIVEPVRTKIERPLGSHNTISGRLKNSNASTSKVTAASGTNDANRNRKTRTNASSSNNGGIKRHFFYQPVRVNRELYEEELPNPDTVRNVRKFFEEHILPTPGQGLLIKGNDDDTIRKNNGDIITTTTKQTSPKSRRARKYRYLTIDTSYGHAPTATTTAAAASKHQQQKTKNLQTRKWDTASLSSGISSGDLSSPCESNETETTQQKDINNTITPAAATDGNNKCPLDTQQHKVGQIDEEPQYEQDAQKVVHVQDIVNKHNSCVKKSRSNGAYGIPVRSSGIRPRSAVYGSMHKTGKSNNYRDIYEYHLHHQDSDEHEADDDEHEEDDQDLFGDVDDDDDELCDTYYVSNDILRKIRECGSSVTYYGGRVVQTTTTLTNPLENFANAGNNGQNAMANNATMTVQNNPTMMTQTQTRARVREIEICCNAANECQHQQQKHQQHPIKKQLEQKKLLNPTKNDNNRNMLSRNREQNNAKNNKDLNQEGGNKADVNGGGGITFKLVKSNSCSSRLELAGAGDIDYDECEDTEVVRKMVHHFETSTTSTSKTVLPNTSTNNDVFLTINSQTPLQQHHHHHDDDDDGLVMKDKTHHSHSAIKQVTVNNHINVAKGNPTQSTAANDLIKLKNLAAHVKEILNQEVVDSNKPQVEKLYQTEAKDIFLGNSANNGVGVCATESATKNGESCLKVCRNKNVDLAYTLVKQQQQPKSTGICQDNAKNKTSQHIGKQTSSSKTNENNNSHTSVEEFKVKDGNKKCVTYENTLLPTMTAVTTVKNSNKMSTGDSKVDGGGEAYKQDIRITTIASATSTGSSTPTIQQHKPSQIIVPVDIHCVDFIMPHQQQQQQQQPQQNILSSSIVAASNNINNSPKGVDEKSFLPLSTTSSVTSVIDKTVVKHYVANDKSIYEKRKYDDIEFEEFEIYDPTKDFEKLIEEEKLRNNTSCNSQTTTTTTDESHQPQDHDLADGQLSSTETSLTATSMKTAKSQQSNFSAETETDCYDSLDDKL